MLPYVPVMCENGRRDREVRRVWRASPDDNSGWNQLNSLDVIQRWAPRTESADQDLTHIYCVQVPE